MKVSIQTKFLVVCILLVLLATTGISTTYYFLAKDAMQRESRQRIRIAFNMVLHDLTNQLTAYTKRIHEFSKSSTTIHGAAYMYSARMGALESRKLETSRSIALNYLLHVADELKNFAQIVPVHRLKLYGPDKRLMVVYQRDAKWEDVGLYIFSEQGNDSYLSLDDRSQATQMLGGYIPIPDQSLPDGVDGHFEAEIPDTFSMNWFSEENTLGIRIVAPVYHLKEKIGVFIGEVFYTQAIVEQYASLSETEVNLFAGNQLSVGTLPVQTAFAPEAMDRMVLCKDMMNQSRKISVLPATFDEQDYYQGQCAFDNVQNIVGAIAISLSQDIEKQEVKRILTAVLTISGLMIGIAFVLSFLLSRKPIHSIHNIVDVIKIVAEGDLRKTATAVTQDEIGRLSRNVNQMIAQLRTLYNQVQDAVHAVSLTSEMILEEMQTLTVRMEQQSTTVDNTTAFVEKINQFIATIGDPTAEHRTTAEQVLSSTHEIRASLEEVTTSTGHLVTNAQHISSSVEQVNRSAQHISESSEQLVEIARKTETEIHLIDHALQNVSQNADRSEQLTKETMDAVQRGQTSVDVSIQSIQELKEVISHSAQSIKEVNTAGEQISSILDIVDDITEQTALLSLNASIISAQAGERGRGFAVVANEIKELAQRTKSSTAEIGSLIHTLQVKTEDSVASIEKGIVKADEGVQLVGALKDGLTTILERATRSSSMAADTAKVIQQTAESGQVINSSMKAVMEMVSNITKAIRDQEQDISKVVSAVAIILEMSEQVNQANQEQNRASDQIVNGMEQITQKLGELSTQAVELKQSSNQILDAMHTIESITQNVLLEAIDISDRTADNMTKQVDMLRKIVTVFKVS